MTETATVWRVDAQEQLLTGRVEPLWMDGSELDAGPAVDAATARLAGVPAALVLGGGARRPQWRERRAGEMPRTDSRLAMLVVGADDDLVGTS